MVTNNNYKKFARGIEVAVDGQYVLIKVDTKATKEPSASGKMSLCASTGGFKEVDETKGFRMSLMGGFKN